MQPDESQQSSEKPLDGTVLARMMLGCLLYRLGGEQSFTMTEIEDIQDIVAGVQFFATEDGKIILRTRGKSALPGSNLI